MSNQTIDLTSDSSNAMDQSASDEVHTLTDTKTTESKFYILTINNVTPDNYDNVVNKIKTVYQVDKLVYQLERGQQGTYHIQMFMCLDRKIKWVTAKNKARSNGIGAWIAPAKYPGKAANYCSKEDTRIQGHGPYYYNCTADSIKAIGQGKRTDLVGVIDTINKKARIESVAAQHPAEFIKYSHGIKSYFQMIHNLNERNFRTSLIVYWGPTGTGKSTRAENEAKALGSYWFLQLPTKGEQIWWDGYAGQDSVIIDDFYGDFPVPFLLRLADKFPLKVPVKNGFVNFISKRIYITSNLPWNEWWKDKEGMISRHFDAIERRIDICEKMTLVKCPKLLAKQANKQNETNKESQEEFIEPEENYNLQRQDAFLTWEEYKAQNPIDINAALDCDIEL